MLSIQSGLKVSIVSTQDYRCPSHMMASREAYRANGGLSQSCVLRSQSHSCKLLSMKSRTLRASPKLCSVKTVTTASSYPWNQLSFMYQIQSPIGPSYWSTALLHWRLLLKSTCSKCSHLLCMNKKISSFPEMPREYQRDTAEPPGNLLPFRQETLPV